MSDLTEPPFEWSASQKVMHWLMAVLIVGQIGLGIVMTNWKPDIQTSFLLIQIHKSIGFTLLVLVLIRLMVRLRLGRPPLPPEMARWERALAGLVHVLLYAVLIAMPLTGWLGGSAAGFSTKPFGLFTLPDMIGKNPDLAAALRFSHNTLALLMIALLALHVAGALKHHLWDRNDILRRMLPRAWS